MKKVIHAKSFFALLCKCGIKPYEYMLCGVFSTKKEAEQCNKDVKDCPAKHLIRKVNVTLHVQ